MTSFQDATHGHRYDYERVSPHLRNTRLRNDVLQRIQRNVHEISARRGSCRVLEIGAGHGMLTEHVVAMGALVTSTEMSRASYEQLRERFENHPSVKILFDPTGDQIASRDEHRPYDLVLLVSVLHHVVDYLTFVEQLVERISPDGALVTYQDPVWYPRQSRLTLTASRWSYYAWRLFQGDFRRGVRTRLRRWRGVLDEDLAEDMVEYHVVRDGIDELALSNLLEARFRNVELERYWSTQAPPLQWLGHALRLTNTFGLEARGFLPTPASPPTPGYHRPSTV